MKLLPTILAFTCLIGTSALAEEHAYMITTELYRVSGDWNPFAEDDSQGSSFGFLKQTDTEHGLDFSGSKLTIKDGDLHWTGTPIKENDAISLLAKPNIMTLNGHKAAIHITQDFPLQMFKPAEEEKAEEKYSLETVYVERGLKISATPSGSPGSDTIILKLKIEYSVPAGNAPLGDTELEAGAIIMNKSVSDTTLGAKEGQWFYSTIKSGEDDHILFFGKVEHTEK